MEQNQHRFTIYGKTTANGAEERWSRSYAIDRDTYMSLYGINQSHVVYCSDDGTGRDPLTTLASDAYAIIVPFLYNYTFLYNYNEFISPVQT